ncbi:MAG: hypothetical protein LBL79_12615 [Prevotella sp.]|jgi:hypothetical protein|nr:hypothetical protein [Prevotella sp.]
MKRYLLIIGLLLLSIVSINCQEEYLDKSLFNNIFEVYEGTSRITPIYTIRPDRETFEVYEGTSRITPVYTIRPDRETFEVYEGTSRLTPIYTIRPQ